MGDKVLQEILDQERTMSENMKNKRDLQNQKLKARMAERRRKKMKNLERKHSMEKKDFDGDMAELEDRHLSERNMLEAELESDEISMNRNLQESLNRESLSF